MWPEAEKVEIRRGLVQEAMSPEISEEKEKGENKIVTRPLSWRSKRFTNILNSLNRKWLRKCLAKARS